MKIIHKEKDESEVKKEGEELLDKVSKMRMNFKKAIARKVEEFKKKEAEEAVIKS